jgi:hypothetical protein
MAEPFLADALEAAKAAAAAIMPATLGATVAQLYERGMAWRDRVIAYVVGISVSWYVTLGLKAWLGFDQFAAQSVSFVLGMIAFKSAPRFIGAASDVIATLPGLARDWLARKGGVK